LIKVLNLNKTCDNIKFVRSDASILLRSHLPEKCIDKICIFFPDPWPNAERDIGRRIIRSDVIEAACKVIKSGGILHLVTDVEEYAAHAKHVLEGFYGQGWSLLDEFVAEPCERKEGDLRAITKYEIKAKSLGHSIWDIKFVYNPTSRINILTSCDYLS